MCFEIRTLSEDIIFSSLKSVQECTLGLTLVTHLEFPVEIINKKKSNLNFIRSNP